MTTSDDSKDDAAPKQPRMPKRRREVLCAGDLNNADIAAIASTEMDPKYRCFDKELDAAIPSLPSSSPVRTGQVIERRNLPLS